MECIVNVTHSRSMTIRSICACLNVKWQKRRQPSTAMKSFARTDLREPTTKSDPPRGRLTLHRGSTEYYPGCLKPAKLRSAHHVMARHGEPARCCTEPEGAPSETVSSEHRREKDARAATRGDKDGEAGVFRTINSAIVA